jgi:transcriptional regulator with GAF, ATPase, and Fis domain
MDRVGSEELHLVVFLKDGASAHRLARDASVIVGRGDDCGVQVDSSSLSRRHFRVHAGVEPSIHDLGSINGTVLNGVRLAPNQPVPLEIGALVEAGGVFFMLRDDDPHDITWTGPNRPSRRSPDASVVVEDPAMVRLHELVGMVARSTMPVLIVGETGVGKEIISAAVHERSARASKALVRINCAALPELLLESELFGFEKGAFTGATQTKPGLIESAHGGSFFLDEIGELPRSTQAKLLRVLESGEVLRLGGLKPRAIDVRFIAATNRPLQSLVASGDFRRDLYYRLNGITIPVPPLRDRFAEIPALARLFVAAGAKATARRHLGIAPEALARLVAYSWPGNVRQLRNVMERAVALCAGDIIREEHVVLDGDELASPRHGPATPVPPSSVHAPPQAGGLMRTDPETDRKRLVEALREASGNQGRAAEILGVSRRTLMKWLDAHGLPRPRKGGPGGTTTR